MIKISEALFEFFKQCFHIDLSNKQNQLIMNTYTYNFQNYSKIIHNIPAEKTVKVDDLNLIYIVRTSGCYGRAEYATITESMFDELNKAGKVMETSANNNDFGTVFIENKMSKIVATRIVKDKTMPGKYVLYPVLPFEIGATRWDSWKFEEVKVFDKKTA